MSAAPLRLPTRVHVLLLSERCWSRCLALSTPAWSASSSARCHRTRWAATSPSCRCSTWCCAISCSPDRCRAVQHGRRLAAPICARWVVVCSGGLAIGLHFALYRSFPLGSHFKFAIGYWILGGGIIAQLEYLLFERALPSPIAPMRRHRCAIGWDGG
jgi:hypothetical protein